MRAERRRSLPAPTLRARIGDYVNSPGFQCDWGDSFFVSFSHHRCHLFICENDQGHTGTWA